MKVISCLNEFADLAVPDSRGTECFASLVSLQRKIEQTNERSFDRLMVWAQLLDAAGWCVAVSKTAELKDVWLSPQALVMLGWREVDPGGWPALLARLESLPADSLAVESPGIRVWAAPTGNPDGQAQQVRLTAREREVLEWLRMGKNGPEIAIILGCAVRTVETHVANLYRKLNTRNRGQAILNHTPPSHS